MTRFCLVAHNALPAAFPEAGQAVGGAETRAWSIARGLAGEPGCQATFVVRHSRKLPASRRDGVELLNLIDPFRDVRRYVSDCLDFSGGFPKVRRWRAGLLWRVPWLLLTRPFRRRDIQPGEVDPRLAAANGDVFIAFGVSEESSQTVATANALGKPAIVCLRSNSDIPADPAGPAGSLARLVLGGATWIIAQTRRQAAELRRLYQREAIHLPNPIDLEEWLPPVGVEREYVLWIGRADDFHKRPLRCLEVARSLPDIPFLMIMNRWDERIARQVRRTRPANVALRDYVSYTEMPGVFARAKAFFSTGNPAYEGFPNVFLQAAATGTPIVTQFDYDDFVTGSGAGLAVGESIPAAAEALKRLCARPRPESEVQTVRDYLSSNHDLTAYCRRLHELASK